MQNFIFAALAVGAGYYLLAGGEKSLTQANNEAVQIILTGLPEVDGQRLRVESRARLQDGWVMRFQHPSIRGLIIVDVPDAGVARIR